MSPFPEEFMMTREARIEACRRSLALLLIHHGAKPPGEEARRAVARLQGEMRVARQRLRPACEQATAALVAKPSRRDATSDDLDRLREISAEVLMRSGFQEADLFSPRFPRPLAWARHEIMYRAANETRLSLPQIGRFLGRDHTAVLHGIGRHAERNGLPTPRAFKERRA